jgi:uncharacterized protein
VLTPAQHVAIAVVALVAGVANSIAGGGMLLTLPTLIALGVPSVVANATCTAALVPASIASILGGAVGGILLTVTSERRFDQIVPWLVLFATLLFVLQGRVIDALERRAGYRSPAFVDAIAKPPPRAFLALFFFTAVYGGYFGGGAGLLMLAAFGLMGLTNIHQMNGLKNFCGFTFNIVAVVAFVAKGLIDWPIVVNMAIGSSIGGWLGSGLAQRVPQSWVRGAVGVIGFGAALWLFASRV